MVGALGVTGWALGDIQVEKIQIWRDPLPGIDPLEAIQPSAKLYSADAAFLADARPDATFPNSPPSYPARREPRPGIAGTKQGSKPV